MKKYIYIASLAALSSMMMSGCSDDESVFSTDGDGQVSLSASIAGDVKVVSRADGEGLRELYGESLKVWLTKPGSGPVRQYDGIDNLPAEPVTMPSGSYVAEAWAGDSVSASWDKKYFKGYEPFDVAKGVTTPVNITCKIANTLASVNWNANVDEVLKPGYTLTVGHSRGTLTFEGRDDRKAYFMMPSTDKDLTVEITGESLDGKAYKQTAVIADVKQGYEYVINVKATDKELDPIGGALFDIEVDATEIVVDDEVVITLAPLIKGVNFDIAEPQTAEQGKMGRKSVYITASEELTSVVIESSELQALIGHPDLDLIAAPNKDYVATLDAAGIKLQRFTDSEGRLTNLRVNFEAEYTATLENGTHTFKFTAADSDRVSEAVLTLDVSDAPIVLNPVNQSTVSYTSATLTARIVATDPQPVVSRADGNGFNYRTGNGSWTFVAGTVNGDVMTAEVSDLVAGSTYEYTAVYNGFETASMTFATPAYPQLPNCGFENWDTSGTAYLPYAAGDTPFWDSGNHGSTTLGTSWNITVPDTEIKHSGSRSIKLMSKKVVIKFAAGNVFAGKYLKTDGTDGILGWGQPWNYTVKPKAVKLWIKYTPVAIDNRANDAPAEAVKGNMDNGIIYCALVDNSKMTEGDWEYPQIVKTKASQRKLFDAKGANVAYYGQLLLTEATPGSGMVEMTFNLDAVNPGLDVSNIIFVASASRWGDYYTGGNGSTMWIDDIELVY